jgi:2-oxoglutarate ferredoxin oxidoreductase subunit alpha
LANGSEPWLLPKMEDLPEIRVAFRADPADFHPYARDPGTLARPWVRPGTPGLEHRIGGLEKQDGTGSISYDPVNHDHMVRLRAEKVARVANDIPDAKVEGPADAEVLIVGWGSTYGAIYSAARELEQAGIRVAQMHLRHLNPMPRNVGDVLRRHRKVLVPEMNLGQLALLLRARYLVDVVSYAKVEGKPFKRREIVAKVRELVGASA